jgi:hypothetical protein
MADEHVLVYETALPLAFIVSDAANIEKGAIVKLADPNTVSSAAALNDVIGGICASEKVASNGMTKLAVYRAGIFKAKASGSITAGDPLVISGPTANNLVQTAAVNAENILGYSRETASDGETFLYELKPTTMQLA